MGNGISLVVAYLVAMVAIVGGFVYWRHVSSQQEAKRLLEEEASAAGKKEREKKQREEKRQEALAAAAAGGGNNKKKKSRLERVRRAAAEPQDESDDEDVGDGIDNGGGGDDGPMTKKKMRKEGIKQFKADERLAQEQSKDRKTEKEEKRQQEQQRKQEEREAAEKERLAEEAKKEEEIRKKEEEEYDSWKDMIVVEQDGTEENDAQCESEGLLGEFIDYIKTKKVVVLDELATEFNLRTIDVINRVKALEESGAITGVIDDRGKFFYIEEGEMDAVAQWITNKGRSNISEIVDACNQIINLAGSEWVRQSKTNDAGEAGTAEENAKALVASDC